MLRSPETTDWSSAAEQQAWFDQFKSSDGADSVATTKVVGLQFSEFRDFLGATIYTYFAARSPQRHQMNNAKDEKQTSPLKFSYQQELQLFRIFDSKNDHVIDRDEFARLCQAWLDKIYRRACALIVVDVQNDFIDGSLALINGSAGQDGAEVVPVINRILERYHFDAVVYTQDWHPPDHIGFHSNLHMRKYSLKQEEEVAQTGGGSEETTNGRQTTSSKSNEGNDNSTNNNNEVSRFKLKKLAPKAKVFDTVLFDEGRVEQKLWPVHCVQNSWGAELHPDLKVVPNAIRVLKGTLSQVDAYSVFWDNLRLNETGLQQELISRKISDVFLCGLALDYCVAASALDSARAGFLTFVIDDACRGIDQEAMERRKEELIENGVLIVNSDTINSLLETNGTKSEGSGNDHNSLVRMASDMATTIMTSSPSSSSTTSLMSCSSPGLGGVGELDRWLLINVCFKRAMNLDC